MVQRAETDTVPGCSALVDSAADVDQEVNRSIKDARSAAGTAPKGIDVAIGVANDIGANSKASIGRTVIEVWAEGLSAKKISMPSKASTKYDGVQYGLWRQVMFPILNPTMKIAGVCMGSDKLGHFFQQGATYFNTAGKSGVKSAEEESSGTEIEGFGLATTGVYSNADQEANRKGGDFYKDLIASPSMSFSITSYVSSKWSEAENPNFYEESVGKQVWSNLLTGSWFGFVLPPTPLKGQAATFDLNVAATGSVIGTFSLGTSFAPWGTLTGTVSYLTTPVTGTKSQSATPISGVQIDFKWSDAVELGVGQLKSNGERQLIGTWGAGSSGTDKGKLQLDRT